MNKKKKKRSGFNWKRRVFWIAFVAFVPYFAFANIFLNSPKFREILASWDDGILVYDWMISPVPGVAFARKPGVTHQDRHVRWTVSTNYAWILFSPFHLLNKEVRFFEVRIGTANFRFVERRHLDSKSKDSLPKDFYPVIAFQKEVKKKTPKKPSDPNEKKWGIHMSGISIGAVREAWVNEYHYSGGIGIQGRFRIIPDKQVEVGPATVHFSPGDFRLGDSSLVQNFAGTIHYLMKPFNPDGEDAELLNSVFADADISAHAETLDPLNFYFASMPWFRLGEGGGKVRLQVKVEKGEVVPPGKIDFSTEMLRLKLGKFNAFGSADLHWKMVGGTPNRGVFNGKLDVDRITYLKNPPFLNGGSLELEGNSNSLSFNNLFKELALTVRLKRALVNNLKSMNEFIPPKSPVKLTGGQAVLDLELQTDSRKPGKDHGQIVLKGKGSRLSLKKQELAGDLSVQLPFSESRLSKGDLHFTESTIAFLDAKLTEPGSLAKSTWWAQVHVPVADLRAEPTSLHSSFQVLMKNSLPLVPLVTGVSNGDSLLSYLLDVENIRCRGSVGIVDQGFELSDLLFDSSSLKVQGFYEERKDLASARMLFTLDPFAIGLSVDRSDTRIILNDAFGWYKNHPTREKWGLSR